MFDPETNQSNGNLCANVNRFSFQISIHVLVTNENIHTHVLFSNEDTHTYICTFSCYRDKFINIHTYVVLRVSFDAVIARNSAGSYPDLHLQSIFNSDKFPRVIEVPFFVI